MNKIILRTLKAPRCVRKASLFSFVASIVSILAICNSCDSESNTGADGHYLNTSVKITPLDSVSSEFLEGVFVGEMLYRSDTTIMFEGLIRGDSLSTDRQYYKKWGYPESTRLWWLSYTGFSPDAPDYTRYVAYKRGYKIWKWSRDRDTIFHLDSQMDSLIIRMVRK
jgi:hypothetical protein